MNPEVKQAGNCISLIALLFSPIVINPAWPVWGKPYDAHYPEGTIHITSASIDSFLRNGNYSAFEHFAGLYSLIALYLSLALILVITVLDFAKKDDRRFSFLSWIFVGLSISVSVFLPFSCYVEWPVMLYDFIPLLAGIAVLIPLIIGMLKAHR